ncbi:MAG: tetratricopeptide repeat protein [Acidobacteria bacterium]|nr:tetratricopeptide repeat protein [Acidobacteriota bacterium]
MPAIAHQLSTAVHHHKAGRLDEAGTLYRRILAKEPDHAEAMHLLGLVSSENGHDDLAASLIARAIKLQGPEPVFCASLGVVLRKQGQTEQAMACFRQAIKGNPRDGRAHFELANLLHGNGRYAEAAGHYEQTVRIAPGQPMAWFNLGVTRTLEQRLEEAIAAYRQALAHDPCYAEAHNNLGILLQAFGRVDEAAGCYQSAIEARASYLDPYYNLGLTRQDQERFEEAASAYQLLLNHNPRHPEALNNLGVTLQAMGHARGARIAYEQALQCNPSHSEARWNLGVVNLLLGDYEAGWEGHEWRFRQAESRPRIFEQPEWTGETLPGARILLHAEQGLGDTLQFIRYASLVKSRCHSVIVEVQPPLETLARTVAGIDEVALRGHELPEFDAHVPLMSLPRLFRTTTASVPAQVPYVAPSADALHRWRKIFESDGSALKTGLVWAGNSRHKNNHNRSMALDLFLPLADLDGVRFFSLQKDSAGPIPPAFPMTDLAPALTDFNETAAAIANLDLVIAVDTAVAHLAGALGKPVWILLPHVPDWRWMLDRDDSPWYPTARLFRQAERKQWKPVIDRVRTELAVLAGQHRSA